jgi:hypothetical protein
MAEQLAQCFLLEHLEIRRESGCRNPQLGIRTNLGKVQLDEYLVWIQMQKLLK